MVKMISLECGGAIYRLTRSINSEKTMQDSVATKTKEVFRQERSRSLYSCPLYSRRNSVNVSL